MNRPANGTTPVRSPRPDTAPSTPPRPVALPAGLARRSTHSKLPRMGQLAIDTATAGGSSTCATTPMPAPGFPTAVPAAATDAWPADTD